MPRRIKPINPEQKFCSPRQAAYVMGVSEYLVYRLANQGKIPGARKEGGRTLIPVSWVYGSQTTTQADLGSGSNT